MTDWMMWLMAAGLLVILELFIGTFYLLMVGIGLLAGSIAALSGAAQPVQYVIAAVVGVLATVTLRHSKLGKRVSVDAARDPNVNLDIGQSLVVDEWNTVDPHESKARVRYRGAMWDVRLLHNKTAPLPGTYAIREMRGSQLIVSSPDE